MRREGAGWHSHRWIVAVPPWLNLLGLLLRAWPAAASPWPPRALPWPFSYLRFSKQEMQVPGACCWCELLSLGPRGSWGCRRSSQGWAMSSSAWFEGLQHRWGGWQNDFISSAVRAEPQSKALMSLWASVHQQHICSINPSQTHKSMALGIYIHTYTRTHSFQLRVTRAFLCVCELTTPVCRHGKKKGVSSLWIWILFLFCEHVRSKKKKFLLTVRRWSSC